MTGLFAAIHVLLSFGLITLVPAIATARFNITGVGSAPGL